MVRSLLDRQFAMKTRADRDREIGAAGHQERPPPRSPAEGRVPPSVETEAEAGAALEEPIRSLLIEIARALHRRSMYPAYHPALRGSTAALAELISEVLRDRPELAIRVGHHQLSVAGALTDAGNPALASLAGQLHAHNIAAVSIARDIGNEELEELLRLLSLDPPPEEISPLAHREWRHLRITFVQYDRLILKDEGESRLPSGEQGDVWWALARSALAEASTDSAEAIDADALARDIEARSSDKEYARRVTRHLMEVEQAIESAPEQSAELRELASDLVARLDADALRRLLHHGTSTEERRQLLARASHSLSAGAVVKLLREIADLEECRIPHAVWLMLTKLARYADRGALDQREKAAKLVREQVLGLLDDWNVAGHTPTDYVSVLETMSADGSAIARAGSGHSRASVEAGRMVRMGIEVGRMTDSVLDSFAQMVRDEEISELLRLVDEAPADNPAVAELRRRVEEPSILASVLEAETPDFGVADRLIERLGDASVDPMLDAIADSDSRAKRSQLYRRLARMGSRISPLVAARLGDDRWYVRRNMLALLDDLGGMPAGTSALPYLSDEDESVRLAAVKLLLREPDERERAISAALDSEDTRTVILALAAAREACPETQVPRLIELALDARAPREVQLHAIRALHGTQAERAVEALLRLARPRRGLPFLRRNRRLPAVALEAISVLESTWADDPRVQRVLRSVRCGRQRRGRAR